MAARPWIGLNQLHMLAKALDQFDSEAMRAVGCTGHEIRMAEQLFEDIDECLREEICEDWPDVEVL